MLSHPHGSYDDYLNELNFCGYYRSWAFELSGYRFNGLPKSVAIEYVRQETIRTDLVSAIDIEASRLGLLDLGDPPLLFLSPRDHGCENAGVFVRGGEPLRCWVDEGTR